MTLSNTTKVLVAGFMAANLMGCAATMNAMKQDASDLYDKANAKKEEIFVRDTNEEIAKLTNEPLSAVEAFDVNCQKVGQEVAAERTSPIYQLENKTYKLACE